MREAVGRGSPSSDRHDPLPTLPLSGRGSERAEQNFMATFHFDLVSPEKLLFAGEVDQVDVPGTEGDFGVLAGHAPLVATLRPGILVIYREGGALKVVVNGGFAEV